MGRSTAAGRDHAAVLGASQSAVEGSRRGDPAAGDGRRSSIRPTASCSATGRRAKRSPSPATACASPTIRRAGQRRQLLCLPSAHREEVSYGTLGPPLLEYGKLRNFTDADTKAAYDKIYNSHATFPCSNMPRFGSSKILTIDQIKDLVALLMSPDSPVNKSSDGESTHAQEPTRDHGRHGRVRRRVGIDQRRARQPGGARSCQHQEGNRRGLRLSLRLRRSAAVLADAPEHAQPLFGLRLRHLQAQAGGRGARRRPQVLSRGSHRHALGEGQYRPGNLSALRRSDQVRGRGLSVPDHLQAP